jgi:hypothetical protein
MLGEQLLVEGSAGSPGPNSAKALRLKDTPGVALKPEEIAYELFRLIVRAEKPAADVDGADRDWVLGTYRACLEIVRGPVGPSVDIAGRLERARKRLAEHRSPEGG